MYPAGTGEEPAVDTSLMDSMAWARTHFGAADLGDRRREKRLVRVAAALAREPRGTLPGSFRRLGGDEGRLPPPGAEGGHLREDHPGPLAVRPRAVPGTGRVFAGGGQHAVGLHVAPGGGGAGLRGGRPGAGDHAAQHAGVADRALARGIAAGVGDGPVRPKAVGPSARPASAA